MQKVFIRNKEFNFLNLSTVFEAKVEWGSGRHGKLWAYHLESFEFLQQENLNLPRGMNLVTDFAGYLNENPSSFVPYTASLRIINWIKFFSVHKIEDEFCSRSLLEQVRKLFHSTENYLQNNHLLENGFALVFAGTFFRNKRFFDRGKKIVEEQVQRQILDDGAHFELSPMYHQLMLHRVLDCIQLLRKNVPEEKHFLDKLSSVASHMLGWMNEMKFENGDMPMINDSANGIAPSCEELNSYANMLSIPRIKIVLKECGFRKFKTATYECLVDVGGLEPAVNAGHGHSDSLSFILYVHNRPFIIDTGISTYENNTRRLYERSTMAHNTVSLTNISQSRLWGSFRVGKRVNVNEVYEGEGYVEASIRFFDNSIIHNRRIEFFENSIRILDTISGEILEPPKSILYVDKNFEIAHLKSKVNSDIAVVEFNGDLQMSIDEALASVEFNKQVNCYRLTILFNTSLITTFTFLPNSKTGE